MSFVATVMLVLLGEAGGLKLAVLVPYNLRL